jgi:hypothetical protein
MRPILPFTLILWYHDRTLDAGVGPALPRSSGRLNFTATIPRRGRETDSLEVIVDLKGRGHAVILASSAKQKEVDHYLDLLDARVGMVRQIALPALLEAAVDVVHARATLDALNAARARVLGRRGQLAEVQRTLGGLPAEQRRAVGAEVNAVRATLEEAEAARRAELEAERDEVALAAETVDVTLPPRTPKRGSLHPVHETIEAILEVFTGLGYRVVDGPQVESHWLNFEPLNIPPAHTPPAQWGPLNGLLEHYQRAAVVGLHPGGTTDIQKVIMARRIGIGRTTREQAGRLR